MPQSARLEQLAREAEEAAEAAAAAQQLVAERLAAAADFGSEHYKATAAAATEKSAELAEDEERMNALRKGLVPAVSVEQASINRMKALRAKHGLGG